MEVDTEVFAAISARADAMDALAGQLAEQDRKISDLTRLISIFLAPDRPAARHAAPKRDRHLRVVR